MTLAPLSKVGENSDLGEQQSPFFANKVVDPHQKDQVVKGAKESQEEHQRIRFMSPLLEYGYPPAVSEYEDGSLEEKPLLLYLPGFDGTFLSPFLQFPELHTIFDVRCMTVAIEDRSTVEDLKASVLDYILDITNVPPPPPQGAAVNATTAATSSTVKQRVNATTPVTSKQLSPKAENLPPKKKRPFYIAGESFGGILACDLALDLCQDKSLLFRGLALINPATCYYRSRLAMEGPVVAASHPALYYVNLMRLLPLFTDEYSLDQLVMMLRGEALPSVIDNAVREAYLGRVAFSLPTVLPIMKQGTLQWRLVEWLEKGSARMEQKLEQLATLDSLRILLVVGENDGTLPSIDEAERLAGILGPKLVKIHVVEGAGHASTCGSRVDLAALFRQAFPPLRRKPKKNNDEKAGLRWPWARKTTTTTATTPGTPGAMKTKIDNRRPRTAMKPSAAKGKGKWLGMEPRYDNSTIGLSPLKYWSPGYYQKRKKQKMSKPVDPPAS